MCSWNFSKGRVLLLVALIVPFYLWAGKEILIFGVPRWHGRGFWHDDTGLPFLAGAVMVSILDFWVGNVDRANWRWLLVVAGILMMAFSVWGVANAKARMTGARDSAGGGAPYPSSFCRLNVSVPSGTAP